MMLCIHFQKAFAQRMTSTELASHGSAGVCVSKSFNSHLTHGANDSYARYCTSEDEQDVVVSPTPANISPSKIDRRKIGEEVIVVGR